MYVFWSILLNLARCIWKGSSIESLYGMRTKYLIMCLRRHFLVFDILQCLLIMYIEVQWGNQQKPVQSIQLLIVGLAFVA